MSLSDAGLNIYGTVVYYCNNVLCKSKRARRSDITGAAADESSCQGRDLSQQTQWRQTKMRTLMSSDYEAEIRSPVYLESWAQNHSDTFSPDGGRRLCVLTETTSKEGRLYLLDASAGSAAFSGEFLFTFLYWVYHGT